MQGKKIEMHDNERSLCSVFRALFSLRLKVDRLGHLCVGCRSVLFEESLVFFRSKSLCLTTAAATHKSMNTAPFSSFDFITFVRHLEFSFYGTGNRQTFFLYLLTIDLALSLLNSDSDGRESSFQSPAFEYSGPRAAGGEQKH